MQHFANEWELTFKVHVAPNWDNVSLTIIEASCRDMASRHPDWHVDMNAIDLSAYLETVETEKRWWIAARPDNQENKDEDGEYYYSAHVVYHIHLWA